MTARHLLLGVLALILVGVAASIGFALARLSENPVPTPRPSPSASQAATCQASVTPNTIRVDPEFGTSEDVLLIVGTGFPPNVDVSLHTIGVGGADFRTDASGSFSEEIPAEPNRTHEFPPELEEGPMTWTITAWGGPFPPQTASLPPRLCETTVQVAVEFTHAPSEAPPTDLSAGDYAEVIAEGVRVRVAPSSTATVVGALYNGDIVHILAPAQIAEGYAWYLVETAVIQSGQPLRGYVAAGTGTQAYLVRTEAPPPPTPTPLPSPSASP